jgi:hypothetical protein
MFVQENHWRSQWHPFCVHGKHRYVLEPFEGSRTNRGHFCRAVRLAPYAIFVKWNIFESGSDGGYIYVPV